MSFSTEAQCTDRLSTPTAPLLPTPSAFSPGQRLPSKVLCPRSSLCSHPSTQQQGLVGSQSPSCSPPLASWSQPPHCPAVRPSPGWPSTSCSALLSRSSALAPVWGVAALRRLTPRKSLSPPRPPPPTVWSLSLLLGVSPPPRSPPWGSSLKSNPFLPAPFSSPGFRATPSNMVP